MNARFHACPMHAQFENMCRGSGTAAAGQLRGSVDLDNAEVKSQSWDMSEPQLDRALCETHLDPTLFTCCTHLWIP